MRLDRNSFAKRFTSLPVWVCGDCREGTLIREPKGTFEHEWEYSKAARGTEHWEPDWIDQGFAVFYHCPSCFVGTIVSGKISIDLHAAYNREDEIERYEPLSFTVAPSAIDTPFELPESVEETLQPIFRHLWSDPDACGGSIRRCVEAVLDDRKVRKTSLKDGKRTSIKTHHRIEHHLPTSLEQAADHLMALKWIGNVGAHSSKRSHSREELLDACEHLEEALSSIYGADKRKLLARRAKAISARKGKPKPKAKLRRRSKQGL